MNFNQSRMRNLVFAALTALATTGLTNAQAGAYVDPAVRAAKGKVKVIVALRDRAPVSMRARLGYKAAIRALQDNARISQKSVYEMLRADLSGSNFMKPKRLWIVNAMVVELPASKIASLENHPDVRAIYPNEEMHIIPDFPSRRFRELGAEPFTYGLTKIKIPELRAASPEIDGSGVTVGVLDTGVDAAHPDLKGKVVGFHDFVNDRKDPYDDHGHGTHVTGTIAGGSTSGTAIGIAPNAKIIMAKVFDADGGAGTDGILAAMQWMADPDSNPNTHDQPALVSNSWGGGPPSPNDTPSNNLFCQATSSWVKLGILPVFAAGNSGPRAGSVGTPGACPEAFAVAATDEKDDLAKFSSRGPTTWKDGKMIKPNIAAPGVAVISAAPGGGYQSMSGTSMATPHVAGLATLLYQINPKMSIEDAAAIMSKTSIDLGEKGNDPGFGEGRIDAFSAAKATKNFRRRR